MCRILLQALKVFAIYGIVQISLFFLYYYFIFDKEILPSLLVPMPIALFVSFIYFLFIHSICLEEN